jgi:hypothetical protein
VYKAGWLHKRGKLNKQWKRRWFVLHERSLAYYKSPSSHEPQGVILVAEGSSALVGLDRTHPSGTGRFTHQIELSSVEGRTFFLTSSTATDGGGQPLLVEWLVALHPRHKESRVSELELVSHDAAPAASGTSHPPRPHLAIEPVQKSLIHMLIKDSLIRMTPAHKVCKIGCGGKECRHCDPYGQFGPSLHTAVKGLHASWVTDSVMASSRPVPHSHSPPSVPHLHGSWKTAICPQFAVPNPK